MGEQVVVETAQGLEFATCTVGNHEVEDSAVVQPLSPVLRRATDADRRHGGAEPQEGERGL